MSLRMHSVETEQWIGEQWVVEKDGKVVYENGAEQGHLFGWARCWIWVLFHPGVW